MMLSRQLRVPALFRVRSKPEIMLNTCSLAVPFNPVKHSLYRCPQEIGFLGQPFPNCVSYPLQSLTLTVRDYPVAQELRLRSQGQVGLRMRHHSIADVCMRRYCDGALLCIASMFAV